MKNLRLGYLFGILLLINGFIYWYKISDYYFSSNLAFRGILVSFLGIGFILFPGARIPKATPMNQYMTIFWNNTTTFSKVMWLNFAAIGLIAAIITTTFYR